MNEFEADDYAKEFSNLLSQINMHLEQLKAKQIIIENIASKIYTDAVIQLLRNEVTWDTIRSSQYLNTYYAIWEEVHKDLKVDPKIEIDQSLIAPENPVYL